MTTRRRSGRAKADVLYTEPTTSSIYHPISQYERWQRDWSSDDGEGEVDGPGDDDDSEDTPITLPMRGGATSVTRTRQEQQRARKKQRSTAVAAAVASAASSEPQSLEVLERLRELEGFNATHRNANTREAYESAAAAHDGGVGPAGDAGSTEEGDCVDATTTDRRPRGCIRRLHCQAR